MGTCGFVGYRRQTVQGQNVAGGLAEVKSRIEQGAVEIEQNGFIFELFILSVNCR